MTRPTLYITQPICETCLGLLQEKMDVEMNPDSSSVLTREKLIEGVSRNDYLFCRLGDKVDEEVMDANHNLKLIATLASGWGEIDIEAARRRNIPVISRNNSLLQKPATDVSDETADMTWGLILAIARKIVEGDKLMRSGVFPGPQSLFCTCPKVHNTCLGIIGMGKIGKAVARRAFGFDMRVKYFSRTRYPEIETAYNAEFESLDSVLRTSDYVSIHLPYRAELHHIIGRKELALMKPTAFIINTSRGALVDQDALYEAVLSGKIAGAALDVYEDEPFPQLPKDVMESNRFVLTPHLGSAVLETRLLMEREVVDNILLFLQREMKSEI